MKYGETTFDLLYLAFAIIAGLVMIIKTPGKTGKTMGIASLILGCGDAFHLIPRVLNYFIDADFTVALGVGKLVTSVTMTVFYLLMYKIWRDRYQEERNPRFATYLWALAIVRIVLCLFPQNGWLSNSSDMTWGFLRNIPFVILGAILCFLYFKKRNSDRLFSPIWIEILFSFLFYLPVAVFAGLFPMLGMLMLPKTICYVAMILTFLSASKQ